MTKFEFLKSTSKVKLCFSLKLYEFESFLTYFEGLLSWMDEFHWLERWNKFIFNIGLRAKRCFFAQSRSSKSRLAVWKSAKFLGLWRWCQNLFVFPTWTMLPEMPCLNVCMKPLATSEGQQTNAPNLCLQFYVANVVFLWAEKHLPTWKVFVMWRSSPQGPSPETKAVKATACTEELMQGNGKEQKWHSVLGVLFLYYQCPKCMVNLVK